MRLVIIADTHSMHEEVKLPLGDVLIHCGDFCAYGHNIMEITRFSHWFRNQPHKVKLLVPGNHDRLLESDPGLSQAALGNGILLLVDAGITLGGVEFYGTPYQPFFFDWAFNVRKLKDRLKIFRKIPKSTDVLITHCPPRGILDECQSGNVGCCALDKHVDRVRPKIHCFGHIHEAYGELKQMGTHFINASVCNGFYDVVNEPVVVDI